MHVALEQVMAIRNSISNSSGSLVCSLSVLALVFGCSAESSNPNTGESPLSTTSATTSTSTPPPTSAAPVTPSVNTGTNPPVVTPTSPPVAPTTSNTSSETGPTGTTGPTDSTTSTSATTTTSDDTAGPAGSSAPEGSEPVDTGEPPTPPAGGEYNPDFKEFVGEECDLPEPEALSPASHKLPDPFLMADGTRMSSAAQWACQRAWLKKNVEKFVHGAKPPKPETVTGTVSATTINVHVEDGGKSADFSFPIAGRPSGASGAVPAMFQADGSGVPDSFLTANGVANIDYSHTAAEGAYNKLYSGTVSIQIKWAWAVSRAIDVLVDQKAAGQNDIIDPTALATTGCSYAGKSAFTVGAFDERIALGIPQESGTGGLGSYRVVADKDLGPNGGEDPEQISEACGKNWLVGNVCNGSVDGIPADAHFLVAMYAPRGFTTLDNNRIGHLGPVAQFTAAAAGAEVFKALGVDSHVGYHGGNDTDPHNHCSFNQSQEETTRKAIEGFLTKKAAPANFMEPKLKNQNDQAIDYDLGKYIEWQTPALE